MSKDLLKFTVELLNEISWDLEEHNFSSNDPEEIRRIEFVRDHLRKAIVYLSPCAYKNKNND